MNQDEVKSRLLKLHPTIAEFNLIFSGKASKRVNGLYHPQTYEIIIHNKNFTDDNLLMYTAIHEFAHHVHRVVHGFTGTRSHTSQFRAIQHQYLTRAEELGIYRKPQSPDIEKKARHIRDTYITAQGDLMKRFGAELIEAEALCRANGVRFEDFVERTLQITQATARTLMVLGQSDIPPELGYEKMRIIASERSVAMQHAALGAFNEGKTPDQVKAVLRHHEEPTATTEPEAGDVNTTKIKRERKRVVKAIQSLTTRLEEIDETLAKVSADISEELQPHHAPGRTVAHQDTPGKYGGSPQARADVDEQKHIHTTPPQTDAKTSTGGSP